MFAFEPAYSYVARCMRWSAAMGHVVPVWIAPKVCMWHATLYVVICSVSVRSFCMCCDNRISAIVPCGLGLLENLSGRPFTGANDLASADAFAPAAAAGASKTKADGTFDLRLL